MAIGSFRGQLESTISRRMGATDDDPYKARRESAQADYQAQAAKARKDLSERLNRLGVLRGSGATATQFGEFESGVLRGQQAIGAQFEAQREAGINQALQQGLGLYGTQSQFDLAGRQQSEVERMGLTQRDIMGRGQTEAERMGLFQRGIGTRQQDVAESNLGFQREQGRAATALARRQQDEFERAAREQERFQAGALTGTYSHPDIYHDQKTMDFRRFQLQERLGLGELTGTDPVGGAQTEAARAQREQEALAQAELTGMYGERATLGRQELLGQIGDEDTLAAQELALRRGQAIGEVDGETTLAAELGRGGLEEQEAARLQAGTQADADRELRAIQAQQQYNIATQDRASRERMQRSQLAATSAEALADRDLRAIIAQQQYDLGGREIDQRAAMQQAQFEQQSAEAALDRTAQTNLAVGDRTFQMQLRAAELEAQGAEAAAARQLAREEMYGQDVSGLSPMQIRALGGTLASRAQTSAISAEERRLDEMEAAGVSQRGLAERELTQRSALAAQQRELEREQLYGRAMTREEQMSGLGYTGGTLASRELTQAAEQADLQRALAREEMYGYREDASGRREQTLGAREAQAQRGLRQQEITQRETMQQAGFEEAGRAREFAALESQRGRDFARGQASLDRSLAEQELYGGTAEIRLDDLGIDPGVLQGYGARPAIEEALTQRLGRAPTSEEITSIEQGSGIMGRQTLAASEAGAARDFEAAQQRARIASAEGLAGQELGFRGEELDFRRREGLEGRRLAREELYGTGDVGAQRGETLAGRQAREDLALRGELGRGQLAQDIARTDLARAEMYGTGDVMLQGGETRAAREARLGRDLERRRLDEMELAGREGRRLETEALYGGAGIDPRGGTLAAREARAGRTFESGERALDRELTRGEADLQRDLAREEMYGGPEGFVDRREGTLAAREGDRDYRLRAELGREGQAIDRSRLDLAEQELYGGLNVDPRGGTLAAREANRAAGFERERLDLASEAGQREAFRNQLAEEELYGGMGYRGQTGQTLSAREAAAARAERGLDRALDTRRTDLAEQELYGYREGAGGYREGTFQAREAGLGRTEREGRYGIEDQRYEDALALEADRYDAARELEADRYATQRGDYQAALNREAEEREFQRQMQVLEVNRLQDEYGGYFNPREEDILGAQLDPNYQAPRNIGEWEDRHPKPTSDREDPAFDAEALADWTEARAERHKQLQGDYEGKRDAWVRANPKMRGESDQQYAVRMLTAVRGPIDRPRAEEEDAYQAPPREWGE